MELKLRGEGQHDAISRREDGIGNEIENLDLCVRPHRLWVDRKAGCGRTCRTDGEEALQHGWSVQLDVRGGVLYEAYDRTVGHCLVHCDFD